MWEKYTFYCTNQLLVLCSGHKQCSTLLLRSFAYDCFIQQRRNDVERNIQIPPSTTLPHRLQFPTTPIHILAQPAAAPPAIPTTDPSANAPAATTSLIPIKMISTPNDLMLLTFPSSETPNHNTIYRKWH